MARSRIGSEHDRRFKAQLRIALDYVRQSRDPLVMLEAARLLNMHASNLILDAWPILEATEEAVLFSAETEEPNHA